MQTVVDAYAPAAEDDGRILRTNIHDGIRIKGQRELLTRLFANLVENSLHHTPPGTTVELSLGHGPTGARAEIADNGPGIPVEERSKVFRRFYRLEQSRTAPGSGLGLSLAAAIAELHGSPLHLLDNHPGLRIVLEFPSA
jgi:signal transduction histidine kinase